MIKVYCSKFTFYNNFLTRKITCSISRDFFNESEEVSRIKIIPNIESIKEKILFTMTSENNSILGLGELLNEFNTIGEKIYQRIEKGLKPKDENMSNFLLQMYVKQRYVVCRTN